MRVLEAIRLIRSGRLDPELLWLVADKAERVQVALILGWPASLPENAATPEAAWRSLSVSQRRQVLAHAPASIRARLPADPAEGRQTVLCRVRVRPPDPCGLHGGQAVDPC